MWKPWVATIALLVGCTKHTQYYCTSDSQCMDPTYPFCDVNGEYPASMGEKNICTPVPANCPVDRCGCTPNAVLSCMGDQIVTCGADGMSTTTDSCALGCATDGSHCLSFDPSNGLGGALSDSQNAQDVVLPPGARLNTDQGTVVDSAGVPINVKSAVVAQNGGPSIRVFVAKSFVIDDATISGTSAAAFVAYGPIQLEGMVDLSARGPNAGPGAMQGGQCAGLNGVQSPCSFGSANLGGGGAGNASAGGNSDYMGGTAAQGASPLVGGCNGGNLESSTNAILDRGGAGGGALQLVSMSSIAITNRGFINSAGGGGQTSAGGGSGGTIVLEAPSVTISGAATGITANGGAGGGCGISGPDGTANSSAATTPGCSSGNYSAGAGGTGSLPPANAVGCITAPCLLCGYSDGGGGGAAGRLIISTKNGAYTSTSSPVLSVAITTMQLTLK